MENTRPARTAGTRQTDLHSDLPFFSAASITGERAGLVRFCTRLTGDAAAAEDLSQEALLVAWRQAGEGRIPNDWQPYLFGIARRLCLNWRSRRSQRELPLLSGGEGTEPGLSLDFPDPDPDPLASLLQSERAQIIDRALAEIDFNARSLLVAYYIDEDPLSEIAGSLGLTENAAAVRMHRSREALKRALAGSLRADAAAHGLLTTDSAGGWDPTRLWCPRCGQHLLQGRFTPGASPARYDYALRCPDCDKGYSPPLGFTSDALPMEGAAVLDGVRGYRAAFKRLHGWWEGYIEAGIVSGHAACVYCGRQTPVRTAHPGFGPGTRSLPGFFTHCAACGGEFTIALGGMLFHAAPLRAFWQAHPRIRYRFERPIRCEGRDAVLVGFEDRQSGARLEGIFDRENLRPLRLLQTK